MGVIVNTDPSFATEGAWTGLHDWRTRHLLREKKLVHPGILESEKSFRVTQEDHSG